jgi:hypothetical protein
MSSSAMESILLTLILYYIYSTAFEPKDHEIKAMNFDFVSVMLYINLVRDLPEFAIYLANS